MENIFIASDEGALSLETSNAQSSDTVFFWK